MNIDIKKASEVVERENEAAYAKLIEDVGLKMIDTAKQIMADYEGCEAKEAIYEEAYNDAKKVLDAEESKLQGLRAINPP